MSTNMESVLDEEGYYRKYSGRKRLGYRYRDHIKSKTATKVRDKEDSEIVAAMKECGFFPSEPL